MTKGSSVVAAAAGGVIVGTVFQEQLRRGAKSMARSVIHALNDGYQSVREDLEDIQAEAASERAQRAAGAPAES